MAITKKQIVFDLKTDKNSPIFKYYNSLSSAYYYIEKYLNENNFPCHRQGSVYTSDKPLTNAQVSVSLKKVCDAIPWLYECINAIDVSSVTRKESLLDDVKAYCDMNSEKKVAMQQEHIKRRSVR